MIAPNAKPTKPGTGLPGYTVPTAPGPTTPALTLTGTFADQQTSADTAWQNALAQLAQQRGQFNTNEGFNSDGSIANNPLSAYGQLSNNLAGNSFATEAAVAGHGLGSARSAHGIGAQIEENTNLGNATAQQRFLADYLNRSDQMTNQETAATQQHTDASNQIKQNMIDFLINNGQHITAAGQLDQNVVDARVKALAAAWMKKNGGGKNSTNKAGMTFQQFLTNHLGAKLYDPSAHYHIGKVSY